MGWQKHGRPLEMIKCRRATATISDYKTQHILAPMISKNILLRSERQTVE